MNQIPNIEETAKEFVTRYHDFTDNKIHDDMERHLTEILHQQLQKAREEVITTAQQTVEEVVNKWRLSLEEEGLSCSFKIDEAIQVAHHNWLRGEIVNLEGMQKENEEKEIDAPFIQHEVWAYSNALEIVIKRYHSELDQDGDK